MSSNSAKSWNRSWSTQEIIDNASNWSLAGDAGLLKYLEAFSDDLLAKAEETNSNLNKLLEDLNKASLSLDVVKNEFSSLHNTQFIENRVYEDDETLPAEDKSKENVEDKQPSEEEKIKVMKEAVMRGITVVDKYFDKVEVPASDSEDETDFPSFVLRPKDPYIDRPLPYVIGTEDWYKKWHVGLLDSSSDSEVDKVSEKFSDSDSENDLPVQDRTRNKGISNSGSEGDILNRMHINQPVANSTFDESVKQPDIFGSSDSEDYSSVPAQAPISTKSFAQELAAKLGHVVEQNLEAVQPEINKRPIQTVPPSRTIGNIFSDEPPPIDEDEDEELFGSNTAQQGLFSGGGGLFDDLDNSATLWKDKKDNLVKEQAAVPAKSKLPNLFDDEDDDIFNTTIPRNESSAKIKDSQNAVAKKNMGGLFDDEEDDLFQESSTTNISSKSYLPPISKVVPFIDNEPPELEPSKPTIEGPKAKKPVGGIKVFENADLFGQQKVGALLKNRRQDSSESSDNDNIPAVKPTDPSPKIPDKPKRLFEEFRDTVANQKTRENESKGAGDIQNDDLFSTKPEQKAKQLSLFDDDDSALFEDDLFSNISSKKFTSSLFHKDSLENDLFANPEVDQSQNSSNITNKSSTEKPADESVDKTVGEVSKMNTTEPVKKSKTLSLFDDDDDTEPDDLFSTNIVPSISAFATQDTKISKNLSAGENLKENIPENKTVQNASKQIEEGLNKSTQPVVNIRFFDQNPPELDEEWDTKSENNLFDDNESALFDNTPEVSSRRSGLFDNEPPSLFYESSGIVPDVSASARVETDDSFNPYASSSRRFSTDIFNEQQSSDSFFVTKNKSQFDSMNAQSHLDRIPEISNPDMNTSSQSNLEITPSGNADKLFSECTVSLAGADVVEPNEAKDSGFDTKTSQSTQVKSLALQDSDDYDLFSDGNNLVRSENTDSKGVAKDEYLGKVDLFESSGKVAEETTKVLEDKEVIKVEKAKEKPAVARKPGAPAPKNDDVVDEGVSSVPVLQDPVSAKIGSPGKLKHNLNINVNALMPGVSLPRKKDLEKSHSFEVASSYEDSLQQVSVISNPSLSIQSKSSEQLSKEASQKSVDKAVNFDNPLTNPEILPSITKDRVRIPVRRRPSTRKARHESIRNSVPDFKIIAPVEPETSKEIEKPREVEKPSESTFEDIFAYNDEDLFTSKTVNVTQTEISKIDFTTKDEPIDRFKSIFTSDSPDSDTDLFAESRSKSSTDQGTVVEDQPKSSIFGGQRRSVINSDSFESADFKKSDLFDDSEEFDDIFSSKKLPPKSNLLKKSLFDDDLDDDDDDIFGPPTSSEKSSSVKPTSSAGSKGLEKKPPKSTQVRKLKNAGTVEDPLSSFMKP